MPDLSYSVSDIQDYFEYILQKHETVTDNPSVMIYANEIENRGDWNKDRILSWTLNAGNNEITWKHEKSNMNKDKNGENALHLEITEVILVHCNIINDNYQQDSIVLNTYVPSKSFGQFLDIFIYF